MVVVQLLAAEQQPPGQQVRGRRGHLKATVAHCVAQTVDHSTGEERLRNQVHGHHDNRRHPEQNHVRQDKQPHAEIAMAAVEVALDPVIRSAAPVILEDLRVPARRGVKLIALQDHALQPEDDRAVRIALLIGVRVMAAVHRHPFFRDRSGAEPQPEAERMSQQRMQEQTAVSLITVQVQRDTEEHDLDRQEGHERVAPEGQLDQTIGEEITHRMRSADLRQTHRARKITSIRQGSGDFLRALSAAARSEDKGGVARSGHSKLVLCRRLRQRQAITQAE